MNRYSSVAALSITAALVCPIWSCAPSHEATNAPTATPEQAITSFKTDPQSINASFDALHSSFRRDPAALRQAALKHLSDPNRTVHYAALYALSLTAEPGPALEALRPLLTSSDLNDRALAASALLVPGDK